MQGDNHVNPGRCVQSSAAVKEKVRWVQTRHSFRLVCRSLRTLSVVHNSRSLLPSPVIGPYTVLRKPTPRVYN